MSSVELVQSVVSDFDNAESEYQIVQIARDHALSEKTGAAINNFVQRAMEEMNKSRNQEAVSGHKRVVASKFIALACKSDDETIGSEEGVKPSEAHMVSLAMRE